MRSTDDNEKKSSSMAKAGMILGTIGTSLAVLNSGANGNGNGGLLGGLLGGGPSEYQQAQADRGKAAITELSMLDKYIMPIMGNVSALQTQAAVNSAVDLKNQEITALLFQMAENNTNAKFALNSAVTNANFQLNELRTNDAFALSDLKTSDAFALANLRTNDAFAMSEMRTNDLFQLERVMTTNAIDKATCNVIKGQPYISPRQMADPYQSASNYIVSRQVDPITVNVENAPGYVPPVAPATTTVNATVVPGSIPYPAGSYIW